MLDLYAKNIFIYICDQIINSHHNFKKRKTEKIYQNKTNYYRHNIIQITKRILK